MLCPALLSRLEAAPRDAQKARQFPVYEPIDAPRKPWLDSRNRTRKDLFKVGAIPRDLPLRLLEFDAHRLRHQLQGLERVDPGHFLTRVRPRPRTSNGQSHSPVLRGYGLPIRTMTRTALPARRAENSRVAMTPRSVWDILRLPNGSRISLESIDGPSADRRGGHLCVGLSRRNDQRRDDSQQGENEDKLQTAENEIRGLQP